VVFEVDVESEDDIFLVVDQHESIPLLDAELNSFEDVCVIVEAFLAEAQFGFALDEI
jgi:hypothetical protein